MAATAKVIAFPSRDAAASPANDKGPRKPISVLRKQFVDDVAAKSEENRESAQAERYFHAAQYTEKELKTYADRDQPAIVFNRIKRKINTVCGIIEKLPQGPKAFPRNPNQSAEDGATIATQALLFAMGWDWETLSQTAARRCAVRGISGAEMVLTKGDQDDPTVEWEEVDQRDFFYDRKSSKLDFTDARRMGTTRWVALDVAIETWPDYEDELRNYVEHGPVNDYERGDERGRLAWISKPDEMIRIVDHWYMVGSEWHYCIYCGNTALEWGLSPYTDEKNRSVNKFEMFSAEVDHDGDHYGFFRDLKGAQDEINHRRSKALHQLHSRKVIADDGAVDDVETARREYARSDGWVVKNKGYEIITEDAVANAIVEGNLKMLAEAKAEIDTYGPNPGLIGTDIPAESGRAIQLLQAAGIAELGSFIIAYRQWKMRCYRKTWNTIQKVWKAPRWIRVTDDENLANFIQVNGWQMDETGRPQVLNQLSALDVDIMIDSGPDAINAMANALDTLIALGSKGAPVPPEAIIELSPLPSNVKQKLLQKMEEAKKPDQLAQQAIMLKLQEISAGIQKTSSEAALNAAKQMKTQAEAQQLASGVGGGQQVDTAADMAKADLDVAKAQQIRHEIVSGGPKAKDDLDLAKAQEIRHKIEAGVHLPQAAPFEPPEPGLFERNVASAREGHARADLADAQRAKTILEAQTIAEAPAGMLSAPPPRPPAARPAQ